MASDHDGDPKNDPKPDAAVQGAKPKGRGRRGKDGAAASTGDDRASGAATPKVTADAPPAPSGDNATDAARPAKTPAPKREPATRATIAARSRAADRSDPRTGTRKIAGRRKPQAGQGEGPVSQADAPASDVMEGLDLSAATPPNPGRATEADAPESDSMKPDPRPAPDSTTEPDGTPDRETQVDAPPSTEMDDGKPAPTGDDPSPHVSQADAPASGDVIDKAQRDPKAAPPGDAAVPTASGDATTGHATTFHNMAGPLPERIAESIQRIEDLGQRLVQVLARRPTRPSGIEGPGPDFYAAAASGWMRLAAEQPARLIEQQVQYWGETLHHMAGAQASMLGRAPGAEDGGPDEGRAATDKRFANPLWQTNPFFAYVREQYRINADAMRRAAADLPIESAVQRRRVDWFTGQIIDMMAPTNFLGTNPDALAKAIETEGQSLVRGLENLVADLEHGGGDLVVSLSDRTAFSVGQNIGTTPGVVVHRDPLFELIQYTPTTTDVHRVPLIILPPWINKFYILDLKPQNSLIRWLVDQGYTLFVVSWKNPGAAEAQTGMDDYVSAYLTAFDKVRDLTGERRLNAVGYCIAGTTLAMALGLLAQQGDDRVASATFLTTLTDFSDQGEFTAYLQDDFVTGIEEEVRRTGYLTARLMQRTFSFLRANDLVWGPAVRHYMMGEAPPAFDLLHWNSDGTNLPAKMLSEYLRGLCQANLLTTEGFPIHGRKVRLADVTTPLCAVACERDHIAPWIDSWRGMSMMGSEDKTFLLAESGHIAGIINPPGRDKYGHYVAHTDEAREAGATPAQSAELWKNAATFRPGSWWPEWARWLAPRSGDMVPARVPENGLEPAPGSYVREPA